MSLFEKIGKLFGKKEGSSDTEGADRYEGDLVNGVREGSGKMVYASGNIYSGEWHNGMKHGLGEFIFTATGERYVGEFEDDVYNGQGKLYLSSGMVYDGRFVKGKRDGGGTLIYPNGDRYEGSWLSDTICGYGKYYYADGRVYRGMFFDNKMTDGFLTTRNDNGEWVELRFGDYVNEPKGMQVYLESYPYANKMQVIKEVREVTGYGLAMAKDIAESAENAPQLLKNGASPEDIDDIKRRFEPLDAVITLEDTQN